MQAYRFVAATPAATGARRAARILSLKIGWGIASVVLLSSVLVEWTQPHPSRWTFLFVLAWLVVSVWTYRAIRRIRREA
jgi:hypothetical protein